MHRGLEKVRQIDVFVPERSKNLHVSLMFSLYFTVPTILKYKRLEY